MTTYNDFGGYGHPDHIRTHLVAVGAFARAGDPAWYPQQLAPEHGGTGVRRGRGRARAVVAGEALRAGDPGVRADGDAGAAGGDRRAVVVVPAEDATPEQIAEFEAFAARMLVPDERSRPGSTSAVDRRALGRDQGARHPDQRRQPVRPLRQGGLGGVLGREAFVRRESRVPAPDHETDLFEGLEGREPGPFGWTVGEPAASTP